MSQCRIKFYTVNSEKKQIETTADNARLYKVFHNCKFAGEFKKLSKAVNRIIEIEGEDQELDLLLDNENLILKYNPYLYTFGITYTRKHGARIDQKIRREGMKKPFFLTFFSQSRR